MSTKRFLLVAALAGPRRFPAAAGAGTRRAQVETVCADRAEEEQLRPFPRDAPLNATLSTLQGDSVLPPTGSFVFISAIKDTPGSSTPPHRGEGGLSFEVNVSQQRPYQ